MNCPICTKEYKGKIGVGVHMARSHTQEERSRYAVKCMTDLVPLIYITGALMGLAKIKQVCNYENT